MTPHPSPLDSSPILKLVLSRLRGVPVKHRRIEQFQHLENHPGDAQPYRPWSQTLNSSARLLQLTIGHACSRRNQSQSHRGQKSVFNTNEIGCGGYGSFTAQQPTA